MTRREAWETAASLLAGRDFAAVAYDHEGARRVVVVSQANGFIEVEVDERDPFMLMDAIESRVTGRQWDRAAYLVRREREDREAERRRG